MGTFLPTFIIIFVTFGLAFFLINLRWVVKGEEFRGSCASNNPMLKNQLGECSVCGKKGDEICQNPDKDKNALPAI
jgi:hypothetical protein